jgi:hypothetical protein
MVTASRSDEGGGVVGFAIVFLTVVLSAVGFATPLPVYVLLLVVGTILAVRARWPLRIRARRTGVGGPRRRHVTGHSRARWPTIAGPRGAGPRAIGLWLRAGVGLDECHARVRVQDAHRT